MDVVLDIVVLGACEGESMWEVGVGWGIDEGCVDSASTLTALIDVGTGESAGFTSMSTSSAGSGLGEEELWSFSCSPLGDTAVWVGGGEGGGVGSRTKGWQMRQGTLGGAAETKFSQHCRVLVAKSITTDQYWDRVRGEAV